MSAKILFILGTRPEAIKLCPLISYLRQTGRYAVRVCITAQHRQMLDQVLAAFKVTADHDLDVMQPGQTLFQSTARILSGLENVFTSEKPALAIVQGDTTTTFCGALGAFYAGVPVAHVEAGLRTGDLRQPFPEEANRVLTTRLTQLHFAPTTASAAALHNEGIPADSVFVTGNTGIDAVLYVKEKLERGEYDVDGVPAVPGNKRLLLVTAHRRESFGEGFANICAALRTLADRDDVHIVYPAHPNPNVQAVVKRELASHPRITTLLPLDYVPFVELMRRAYILITDSGGVQEEGPSLGKPILVLRNKTERPEAVQAGTVRLVGTDPDRIVHEANLLLDSAEQYNSMAQVHNPYGDGHACGRIERAIAGFLTGRPAAELTASPL